jgi:hypothetical protein
MSDPTVQAAIPYPALARRAAVLAPDEATWLVPAADDRLCEITQLHDGAGAGCMSLAAAEAARYVSTTSTQSDPGGPETVLVTGVVPDGVKDVKVITTTGASVDVPVQANVYLVELDAGVVPQSISVATSTGHIVVDVPFVPAESAQH